MLVVRDRGATLCDGLTRRELLRIGGLGLFGGGLLNGDLFDASLMRPSTARANTPATSGSFGRAKSCIVLFLMGGPPQHSTWDPKPNAPAEVRGEIPPIGTSVPGIQVGELMPRTAKLMDHIAVLRAVATDDNAHSSSGYAMLTGQPHSPLNVENANPGAPNNWPSFGAVVQQLRSGQGFMPGAVRMPMHIFNTDQSIWPGQDSGFLGAAADPWLLRCDPAAEKMSIAQLDSPAEIPAVRLNERRALLDQLDGLRRQLEPAGAAQDKVTAFSNLRRKAFDLLSLPQARSAFDLRQESAESRDRYGRGQFGQSVLLARRLVEAGVGLVQVNWFRGADEPSDNPCWDSHTDETNRLKNVLIPPFDLAYSALLTDLRERGKLDETLVVCMSEFGRSPKFNNRGGREHWGSVFSVALAGGGIRGGCVHGESDKDAAYPISGRVQPGDLTATMFHCLGISPETQINDHLGRPLPITRGAPIAEILT